MSERTPTELMHDVGHGFFAAAPAGWVTGSITYRRVGMTAEARTLAHAADGLSTTAENGPRGVG